MVSPRLATASRRLLTSRLLRPTSTTHSVILASSLSSSSSSTPRPYSSGFQPGPSPPRLPPEQQAEFERLQRAVAERFVSTPSAPTGEPSPTSPSPASTSRHVSSPAEEAATTTTATTTTTAQQTSIDNKDDDELSAGGVWRGAKPEFEGDVNPKTGEVGGPKNEPLRWGSAGDWSYNGRVTDF